MGAKKTEVLWIVSFVVIILATIILAGSNFAGIELPDIVVRITGAFDLVALPILAFLTVKKMKSRK